MDNPYKNALRQLARASEHMEISDDLYERLKMHDRVIVKDLEIKLDNGKKRAFRAYRAQHNNARGPYKGGLRYCPTIDEDDTRALSMWMTWKCAIAGIPFGGGKGGVRVNPKKLSQGELMRLSHEFGKAFAADIGVWRDVPGPDLGTNEQVMAWIRHGYEEVIGGHAPGVITGKPVGLDGIEMRTEATGRGGFYILEALTEAIGKRPNELTLAVQGLGNVGYWFSRYGREAGYKIIAISDSESAVIAEEGLNIDEVKKYKEEMGSLKGFAGVRELDNGELLELPVDILVPAAVENVITRENAAEVKAKYVIELANGPVTPAADEILKENGVVVIADVLANAGGVVVSYFEWAQNMSGYPWDSKVVFPRLEKLMKTAFAKVWEIQQKRKVEGRAAAYIYGVGKVLEALRFRL